jgi:chemotaxis protein MotB
VTAMMAFFMVMWLISSVNKQTRAAIFDYFKNPSMEQGKSVKPAPGQAGPGGASTAVINWGGGLDARRSSSPLSSGLGTPQEAVEKAVHSALDARSPPSSEDEARKLTEAADRKKLESLMQELRQAIDMSQALKPFKDQLLLDITPEGLRIQIVDAQNRAMFDRGSATLKDYTASILKELAPYLNSVPNRISVSGHTDTTPYVAQNGATNWDLSADRANAARRALERGGLATDKVARIVGLSSAVLFDKDNPRNPINRRISIIVMTKSAEESAAATDAAPPVAAAGLSSAMPVADNSAATRASAASEPSAAVDPKILTLPLKLAPDVPPATAAPPVAH